jgi:hypothetical protein
LPTSAGFQKSEFVKLLYHRRHVVCRRLGIEVEGLGKLMSDIGYGELTITPRPDVLRHMVELVN